MSSKILFTLVSGNKKTGPIPVSTSAKNTCPDACAFKLKGCYAAAGALNIHWMRLTAGETGIVWTEFLSKIRKLRVGTLWRHNQAGDLAGVNDSIDRVRLLELADANKGKKAICYTHKPVLDSQSPEAGANRESIKLAAQKGFSINLSANNLQHADKLVALGIGAVVAVVPSEQIKNCLTPAGNRVVICPATIRNNVTCANCGLCAFASRKYIIGFPAHGNAKRFVDTVAKAA